MNNKAFQSVDAEDERRLIKRAKRGDERAFRMLMERYQRRIYSLAYGMVRDREQAMDITQEVFIKVYRFIRTFQGNSSFYTWLYRIAMNKCIDHIRRRKKDPGYEFNDSVRRREPDDHEALVLPTYFDSNPLNAAARRELAEHIQQALDSLSPHHRAILVLREIEGMSYSEIAKTLKIHKGTVMSRLFHARRNFQRALAGYLASRGDFQKLLEGSEAASEAVVEKSVEETGAGS